MRPASQRSVASAIAFRRHRQAGSSCWLHNELGWFNRISDAMKLMPTVAPSAYRLFAYRLCPERFRNGIARRSLSPRMFDPIRFPRDFNRSVSMRSASRWNRFSDSSAHRCRAIRWRAKFEQTRIVSLRRWRKPSPEPRSSRSSSLSRVTTMSLKYWRSVPPSAPETTAGVVVPSRGRFSSLARGSESGEEWNVKSL